MKDLLRPILKPIVRSSKKSASDFLLKMLLKIDKSFIVNTTPQGTWWNNTQQDQNSSVENLGIERREAIKKPLVVNEGSVIANSEMLRLLFETVFQEPEFTALEKSIFETILNDHSLWGSYGKVISGAKSLLEKKLKSSGEADQTEIKRVLEKISLHEDISKKNRLAYSLEDKTNTNAVFWPDPTMKKKPRSVFDEAIFARTYNFLKKETPIGSAGSCFAIEIAHKLQTDGYNYLVTEPHLDPDQKYYHANARWGTIFNTPSFRQLIERAFGVASTPRLLWTEERNGKLCYLDPFREDVVFNSVEEYEKDYEVHLKKAREALTNTKVFVITLGVNEVWYLRATGHVFSRSPWQMASSLVDRKVMSVQENLKELQTMLDIWRTYNPDLKLIVSVSPVPLHATFRANTHHVMESNAHSKATLRVTAEEFVKANKDVYYFPSFETVMYGVENPWEQDQRHVSRKAVARVMGLFDKMFLQ